MLIKKIQLNNFLSFSDVVFNVGPVGVLLVSGRNGAGKSSLTSKAITWGLFGETPGGVKGDDVSNNSAPKETTTVKIWIDIHGVPWVVERSRNPNRLCVTNSVEGREVNFRHMKETQEFLNELLGRDLDGFLSADYFGQDSKKRFLQTTSAHQQQIVESILKIDERVEPVVEHTKKTVESLTEEINQRNQSIYSARAQIENYTQKERTQTQREATLGQEIEATKAQEVPSPVMPVAPVPPAPLSPPADPPRVPPVFCDVPELPQFDVAQAEETIASKTRLKAEREESGRETKQQIAGYEEKLSAAQAQHTQLSGQINSLKGKVREIKDQLCPTCEQPVNKEFTAGLVAEQAQISEQIQQLTNQLTDTAQKIEELKANIHTARSAQESVHSNIEALGTEIISLSQQIQNFYALQNKINAATETNRLAEEKANQEFERRKAELFRVFEEQKIEQQKDFEEKQRKYQAEVDKLNREYSDRVAERATKIASLTATLAEIQRDIKETRVQRLTLEKNLEASEKQQSATLERCSLSKKWLQEFRRPFKRFMLEQCLPFLNERTAHHLALLGNPQIEVEFSTTKTLKSGDEKGEFLVVARERVGGRAYSHLSGGERQMASFAAGLALAELADIQAGAASQFMILDEPFTELDPTNCGNVVQYITTELLKGKQSILLISNDPHLRQLVANRVEVVKNDNGISSLEVG